MANTEVQTKTKLSFTVWWQLAGCTPSNLAYIYKRTILLYMVLCRLLELGHPISATNALPSSPSVSEVQLKVTKVCSLQLTMWFTL